LCVNIYLISGRPYSFKAGATQDLPTEIRLLNNFRNFAGKIYTNTFFFKSFYDLKKLD
jgi:hypothetical protein